MASAETATPLSILQAVKAHHLALHTTFTFMLLGMSNTGADSVSLPALYNSAQMTVLCCHKCICQAMLL